MNPSYPAALETWWLNRAALRVGKPAGAPVARALAPLVLSIGDSFTTRRGENAGAYSSNAKAWLAYGLFYFPQTFMRVRFVLEELRARGFPWPAQPRVLDLGTGSGAATAALVDALGLPGPITLLDRSTVALDFAFPLLNECHRLSPKTVKGDLLDPPEGPWDIILVSYALNEALARAPEPEQAAWMKRVAARLAPGGLLLICEPLIDDAGPFLDRLRSAALTGAGLHIWAPCPHEAACPLAARKSSCHDVRNWRMPPSAQTLNNLLGRSIQDLKFSFLALSPLAPPATAAFRIVAPVHAAKGKWEIVGCTPEGALRRFEILKRDTDAADRRLIGALERGETLQLVGVEQVGESWRGRISPPAAPSP